MNIFETLKKAIFHNPMARQSRSRPAEPAATTRAPSATPARPAGSAAQPSGAGQAATARPPSPGEQAEPVDVEDVLEALSAKSTQKLNWRTSIVDLMKLLELDSSLERRKELADELGFKGDKSDSAAMNIWLHKAVMRKLAENGGKVPASLQ
jgi:3-oxoacyl-ACP reductase-like protein